MTTERDLSVPDPPSLARVIAARPTLDAPAAAELRREAKALLARSLHPLVVDLTAVRTAEPAAAAALRDLAYEAGDVDVDLRIVRARARSAVTRAVLDDRDLFEIYPTLDAALRHTARADPARASPTPDCAAPPAGG